ncbi:MAG: ArgE/DapE family deacylase [Acidobacteriia bacterium]|nr:ArgE/DapE family deacylase [Terriglobia bacterium]
MDPTIQLLQDLVAVDSVNPSLVAGGAGETRIAAVIAAELQAAGLDVEIMEAAPGRPNVVGILEGRRPGRSLLLCGHMDTVGITGMTAPFDPVVAEGRLYGRGAEDMKGGVAAMLGAARAVAQSGGLPAGRLIIAAVADEEYASLGAEALVARWSADAAVVTEPTGLMIATGHKGFTWVEIVTEGVAAHGSRPREGRDAIFRMARVLARLEVLDRELQSREAHPVMGTASLHASLISGGRELSTYPESCVLRMERRSITGEHGDTALGEVEAILAALRSEDEEFRASARLLFDRLPYEIPAQHFLIPALEDALAGTGRIPNRGGASFWTDAAVLGHGGIPSVIFGPGGGGLHGPEEYVNMDEVLVCRDVLTELARIVCVGEKIRPKGPS